MIWDKTMIKVGKRLHKTLSLNFNLIKAWVTHFNKLSLKLKIWRELLLSFKKSEMISIIMPSNNSGMNYIIQSIIFMMSLKLLEMISKGINRKTESDNYRKRKRSLPYSLKLMRWSHNKIPPIFFLTKISKQNCKV